jgi:beta-lactamase class D
MPFSYLAAMIRNIILAFFSAAIFISSCTYNKAKINNDLKKYFDSVNVEGSFSFMNNQSGEITLYNMTLDTQRVLPASSFEIINTLIGVQTGRITDEKTVVPWNGKTSGHPEWDKDLTLKEAFQVSAVPYFQEIARRIGHDTMKLWIDSLQYGNKDISGPIDSFWLNNHLKISPDEQLGLMFRLYFDKLPFQKYAQEIVRSLMLQEDNTLFKFSYKAGWGYDEQNHSVGWVVGYIEENRHVYFFVTLMKSPDKEKDMKEAGLRITKNILSGMGFFKGEK